MVTTRKDNKKTARSCDSTITTLADERENNDPKRQRTNVMLLNLPRALFAEGLNDDSEEHQHQQAAAQDLAVSAIDEVVDAVNHDISNDDELPTTNQLSQELCKIVDIVHYSRDESVRALANLHKWACTEDHAFLKSFHTYGGIAKVLDFLKATMNDGNCKGSIRMECIESAANVISTVTYSGENDDNNEIAKDIATTLLNCDGINTLISASEEYTGGGDIPQLKAVRSVWNAIMNLTYIFTTDSLSQDEAITIFDTGIDVISQVKSVGGHIASETLEHVLYTFYIMLYNNHVITKKYFQDKNILSKCLEVFKKNGAWDCRTEKVTEFGINFFNSCHIKHLLDDSSDYEMILPLLVIAIKKYPSNDEIRKYAMKMMNRSCSTINDKKKILRSGVMESLGVLLASDEINDNEDEKNKIRTLITKIIA
jgi:hypothetical protein